jgi:hypothetical protein
MNMCNVTNPGASKAAQIVERESSDKTCYSANIGKNDIYKQFKWPKGTQQRETSQVKEASLG